MKRTVLLRLVVRTAAVTVLVALLAGGHGFAKETTSSNQTSASADAIFPVGDVELVKDGFQFTEGPAWDESGILYFSDIPNTAIHRVHADGTVDVFTLESKHTNGIVVAADGRILACQMDGQVVVYDKNDASATVLANAYEGKRFNAPNDLVIDKQGGIYFTDPLYRAPTPLPQGIQAVYYIANNGDVTRVTAGIDAPNGIGLSPDGKKLYVCPSKQAEMLVYDVLSDGKLSDGKMFCRLTQPQGKRDTGADGITLDVQGNVYITTHLGVEIFSPAGKSVGLVRFPHQPANVTFGGADRKTMYVTARGAVYRVKMPIAGLASN
ncbi:Gluconolactonase precursor [Novipirellula galeiformis]|uniref:Gluconolactonase n=1 Tax=Novipirellula galeiformis TaxID=2528004 RepID=A0A5C6CR68_9BACT|nr:SMP-30/gluconolactonase/LRE family protein [Novipirellula galeiformis]TWU26952.1 Gluconolactonase precursor [Novipirellula galeiformis]